MSGVPAVTLEIIPCIDSLLYAPIHIAIASLVDRSETRAVETESGEVTLKGCLDDFDVIKIRYAPAENGDKKVIARVRIDHNEPNTLRIGLCDPLSVVSANYDQLETSGESVDDWRSTLVQYQIHAVFIDKISLSLFARIPGTRPQKNGQERDEHLRRIINALDEEEINYPERFRNEIAKYPTICEFWGGGETTRFIVHHFLKLSGTEYRFNEMPKPDFDLGSLTRGQVDLAVTHAPWSLNWKKHTKKIRLFTRECFPSIQFPFSCVVAPEMSSLKDERRNLHLKLLTAFLREVRIAILLIHDDPKAAKKALNQSMAFFRYYGLGDEGYTEATITRALNHFMVMGCFSSDLNPDWTCWLQAFLMDRTWSERIGDGRAWRALDCTLNYDFSGPLRNREPGFEKYCERLNDLRNHVPKIESKGV